MTTKEEVLSFIKQFQTPETIRVFTEGMCYWFAIILYRRFRPSFPSTTIMYHPVNNHFAVRIERTLYDITGEINRKGFKQWKKYALLDELVTERIYKDCILKVKDYDV